MQILWLLLVLVGTNSIELNMHGCRNHWLRTYLLWRKTDSYLVVQRTRRLLLEQYRKLQIEYHTRYETLSEEDKAIVDAIFTLLF